MELYFIKIYPSTGDVYVVGVSENTPIDDFIDEHLQDVEWWEPINKEEL